MLCYRIVRPAYAATALSGEGARLYGGRWNPPGWRCVYTAESRALAILEMLVHLEGKSRQLTYRLLTLKLDESSIHQAGPLPSDWQALPAGHGTQSLGLDWLQTKRGTGLRVPSVLVPEEHNILLNPAAPAFDQIQVVGERDLRLDMRLS